MKGPQRLGAILAGWTPRRSTPDRYAAEWIGASWADVVGPEISRRTRPGTLRDGVLTVYTAGSTWSHQLTFLAPTIVAALRDRNQSAEIKRLRFVVASGRTKTLLDGLAASVRGARRAPDVAIHDDDDECAGDADAADGDDVHEIVNRLRRRQEALDRRRARDDWSRCATCGAWQPPGPSADRSCAVCSEEARRAADNRVERVVANAPWLRRADIAQVVPDADEAALDRVRRRLLTRWEDQLFSARRRLRRDELTPGDRIVAWSYLMLLSNLQQRDIGRAVVTDVLGAEWAQALAVPTRRPREATAASREKHANTNARVFKRANHRQ